MREIKVVIGKNFGDEGKGAVVDRFCQSGNALVVRHNGGAQAGHTVEEGDFCFVFHQLGSGSLRGCPVFWSKTFLPDLFKLGEEVEEFRRTLKKSEAGRLPQIYADPECACVTIYDVILNSLAEELRGDNRHGSCGMGIYETVLRTENDEYALRLRDFVDTDVPRIVERLQKLREGYVKPRVKEILDNKLPDEAQRWINLIWDDNVLWNTAETMLENFQKFVTLADWQQLSGQYERVVFEGAQGLMLDWDNEEYAPHLTASYTGLKNVARLLMESIDAARDEETSRQFSLEICYVTRTYVTRHGAGRLDFECTREEISPTLFDRTNQPNPWQGKLRYGRHPAGNEFFRYIRQDLKWLENIKNIGTESPMTFGVNKPFITLCVTHLDETKGKILFADGEISPEDLEERCREQGIELRLVKAVLHGDITH